mmetsp:Transcript_5454/g.12367  ORF Transcript_5454/g.12367 Transcript_5454/m.12367 type:complete len:250 (+) Transcript_5454:395-1144(+)
MKRGGKTQRSRQTPIVSSCLSAASYHGGTSLPLGLHHPHPSRFHLHLEVQFGQAISIAAHCDLQTLTGHRPPPRHSGRNSCGFWARVSSCEGHQQKPVSCVPSQLTALSTLPLPLFFLHFVEKHPCSSQCCGRRPPHPCVKHHLDCAHPPLPRLPLPRHNQIRSFRARDLICDLAVYLLSLCLRIRSMVRPPYSCSLRRHHSDLISHRLQNPHCIACSYTHQNHHTQPIPLLQVDELSAVLLVVSFVSA